MPPDDAIPLTPEISKIISEKPPHWEAKLLQSALRVSADGLNSRATHPIDPVTFSAWVRTFIPLYEQLVTEWTLIPDEFTTAFGSSVKAGDADLIMKAVIHLVDLTSDAIILQHRVSVLAKHPVFGALATPLQGMAKPFVDAYNDLLDRLDQQVPNIDTTHHIDLRLTLKPPPGLDGFADAFENYIAKFGLDRDEHSRSRDSIKERFQVARGEQQLGEFGRSAIADNLAAGLFRSDDWYWSDDSQQWKPLSSRLQ
jgi:hypothetical protein